MNKKKNNSFKKLKGFTLIEVLAVIVILAALSLIVIPIINSLIRAARIKSAVASTYGYVEAANNEIIYKTSKGQKINDTLFDVEINLLGVEYKGKGPSAGWYKVDNIRVKEGEFCIWGYDIKYENGRATYVKDGDVCPHDNDKDPVPPEEEPTGVYVREICEGAEYDVKNLYKVKTVEDLVCLSQEVLKGNTFSNNTINVVANIDFNDDNSYIDSDPKRYGDVNDDGVIEDLKKEVTTGKGFRPVGTGIKNNYYTVVPYQGVFDGGAHFIKNLYVNRPSNNYIGLFGELGYNGKVVGLNLTGVNVTGNQYVGGLVGYGYSTCVIQEITIRGKVEGNYSYVGGLIGYTYYPILSVVVGMDVKGPTNIGGMGGYISTSYYYGVVESGNITLTNNYSRSGKASGGYTSGTVYTSSNVVLSDEYYERYYTAEDGIDHTGSNINNLNFYSSINYTYNGDILPLLETKTTGDINDSGYYFDYDNDGQIIVVKDPKSGGIFIREICEGTETYRKRKYIASKVEDLVCLSKLVSEGKNFPNMTINLNDSLDITNNSSYADYTTTLYGDINEDGVIEGLKEELTASKGFIPIGKNEKEFSGKFFGNGNTISNIYINRPTEDYVGLFGKTEYIANISALIVDNADITGYDNTGILIGYNDGIINEVVIDGEVTGNEYVGGVFGYNDNSNVTNIIANSNVTGEDYVGGIAGYSNRIFGVLESGIITSSGVNSGKVLGNSLYGIIYTSTSVTLNAPSDSTGSSGRLFVPSKNQIALYDEVIDTYIAGDSDGSNYYFDYEDESEKIVLKPVTRDSFNFNLSGNGTKEDPYLLRTEEDFKQATLKLRGEKYFQIPNSIDISTFNHFYGFGNYTNYFDGVIDGASNTLSNVELCGGTYSGIIGYLNNGTVKNLNINNLKISSIKETSEYISNYVGGVVGFSKGKIENINLDDLDVKGIKYVGGLVGSNQSSTEILAVNISNAKINGENYVGGLAGYNYNGIIKEATVRGNIEAKIGNAGGITGYSSGSIYSTLVDVNVKGPTYVGGIAGYTGYSDKLYNIVEGYKIEATKESDGSAGRISPGSFDGLNYAINNLNINAASIFTDSNSEEEYDSSKKGDLSYYSSLKYNTDNPILESEETGDVNLSKYYFDYNDSNKIVVVPAGESTDVCAGLEKSGNTYNVATIEDLVCISKLSSRGENFQGKTIKLINDLNFTNAASYRNPVDNTYEDINEDGVVEGLKKELTTGRGFYPIKNFNGTFNGQNKKIENLYIDRSDDTTNSIYAALISQTSSSSSITRLELINPHVKGTTYVGSLVGMAYGYITYVNVADANVEGNTYVGGLAGLSQNYTNINNNTVTSTVTGTSNTGGLVGKSNYTKIQKNTITSTVVGSGNNIGGVVGDCSDTISNNTINTNVTNSGQYTGGVCGYGKSSITDNTITSVVDASDRYAGGVVGWSEGYIGDLDINVSVTGAVYVGGVAGANGANIQSITGSKIEVNGTHSVGGIAGYDGQTRPGICGSVFDIHIPSTIIKVTSSGSAGGITSGGCGNVEEIEIVSNVTGSSFVGGVIGDAEGKMTVKDIIVTSTVRGTSTDSIVGGAIGNVSNGDSSGGTIIEYEKTNILVRNTTVTSDYDSARVGGAIGYILSGATKVSGVLVESGNISGQAVYGLKGLGAECKNCHYYEGVVATVTDQLCYPYKIGGKNISSYESALTTPIGAWDPEMEEFVYSYFNFDRNGIIQLNYPSSNWSYRDLSWELEGNGTVSSPYLIYDADDWNNATLKAKENSVFKLMANIDFTGKEFYKMGSQKNIFQGTLDGNGKTIKNVTLEGGTYLGIFGYIGSSATVKDLTLQNINISKGSYCAGILAGYNESSNLSNISIVGGSVTSSYIAGGILGYNAYGVTVNGLHASGVTVTGVAGGSVTSNISLTGGLVGDNRGTLSECSGESLTVTGLNYTGGLAGYSGGAISGCTVSATVSGNGVTGGVAGQIGGSVTNCTIDVTVTGTENYIGGVVGYNYGTISGCTGSATVSGVNYIGGLVGSTVGSVSNCSVSATVTGNLFVDNLGHISTGGSITDCD